MSVYKLHKDGGCIIAFIYAEVNQVKHNRAISNQPIYVQFSNGTNVYCKRLIGKNLFI